MKGKNNQPKTTALEGKIEIAKDTVIEGNITCSKLVVQAGCGLMVKAGNITVKDNLKGEGNASITLYPGTSLIVGEGIITSSGGRTTITFKDGGTPDPVEQLPDLIEKLPVLGDNIMSDVDSIA